MKLRVFFGLVASALLIPSIGGDTGVELLGRYFFTDWFAFTLETDLGEDFDTLIFGFRAEF